MGFVSLVRRATACEDERTAVRFASVAASHTMRPHLEAYDHRSLALPRYVPGSCVRSCARVNGRRVTLQPNESSDYPLRADIAMGPGAARVEMIRR